MVTESVEYKTVRKHSHKALFRFCFSSGPDPRLFLFLPPTPICSEQTRVVLTSAAYVHLKQAEISKYTRNLAPASRAILLSGPAGKLSPSQQFKVLLNHSSSASD